jgi:hypothetical protein
MRNVSRTKRNVCERKQKRTQHRIGSGVHLAPPFCHVQPTLLKQAFLCVRLTIARQRSLVFDEGKRERNRMISVTAKRQSRRTLLRHSGKYNIVIARQRHLNYCGFIRFEAFKEVTKNSAVFWDVMPCGSCKNRRFGGSYRLHHQSDKNRRARNNVSKLATEARCVRHTPEVGILLTAHSSVSPNVFLACQLFTV